MKNSKNLKKKIFKNKINLKIYQNHQIMSCNNILNNPLKQTNTQK